jgi:uncharacterized Fe-S radical SAM superfamily protein PflX
MRAAKMSYNRDSGLVAAYLGAKNERLPAEGTDRARYTLVYGRWKGVTVDVWVRPSLRYLTQTEGKVVTDLKFRRTHRMMAECPYCPFQCSFGRLEQHLTACALKPSTPAPTPTLS